MKSSVLTQGFVFLVSFGTVAFSFISPLTAQEQKPCICVIDFVNPDIIGQKKFLNFENRQITIGKDCTLDNVDRAAMNSIMQGYVRMIDARDIAEGNRVNRQLQLENDRIEKAKTLDLYRSVVKGEARPILLGSDYLTASLGRHPDAFRCMDSAQMQAAMAKVQNEADFPRDFLLRLAQETGATHLVYGSIADLHSKLKTFKGYGIETKAVTYELDVLLKVVDLPAQKIIYSKVYTGVLVERDMSTGGIELDGNKYQTLMKSAMEQAGEDLYARFLPGKADSFKVTPIPAAKKSARNVSDAPAAAGQTPPKKIQSVPAAVVPASKTSETVVIQQNTTPVRTADGFPAAPVPPVPTPVAAEGNSTVVITTGTTAIAPVQTTVINTKK